MVSQNKVPDIVIQLSDIRHSYTNGVDVLKGVSLTVERGEIVAIIGLSGAGKSTLLRCLNGLIAASSGDCVVLGRDVRQLSGAGKRDLRRNIGMIFQEFNLIERLSVLKNVLVGRLSYVSTLPSLMHWFRATDVAVARENIAHVGLRGFESRRVRNMSGGQKQRVAIARAMTQQPQLVLADEATANLDVLTKDGIMELIRNIALEHHMTVVLSMHDLPLAKRYCTRIVGLKDGLIVFDAKPENLDSRAIAAVLGDATSGSGSAHSNEAVAGL